MDNHEKYAHWEDIAQYDLETAKAMLSSGRFPIRRFYAYYISERYPSYREKLSTTVNRELAEEVLEKTDYSHGSNP